MSEAKFPRRSVEALAHVDAQSLDRLRTVVRSLKKDDSVGALLNSCNSVGEAYLFGGQVRDALLGSAGAFGDVDIFVSGPLNPEFAERVARVYRRTNFGGMRLVVGRYDVDIWELAKSDAFRYERGLEKNIKGLLSTVCFSTDAVAVSLVNGRVLADGSFNRTIKSRVFEFVSAPQSLELLQVVRIGRLCVKNGVTPNLDVGKYFVEGVDKFGIDGLIVAEQKWKGRRVLDERLIRFLDRWCRVLLSTGEAPSEPVFGGDGDNLFPTRKAGQDLPYQSSS